MSISLWQNACIRWFYGFELLVASDPTYCHTTSLQPYTQTEYLKVTKYQTPSSLGCSLQQASRRDLQRNVLYLSQSFLDVEHCSYTFFLPSFHQGQFIIQGKSIIYSLQRYVPA